MKLDKKVVNEVIKWAKKYYETGDLDYLPALFEAKEVLERSMSWQNVDLIEDLAKYTQRSRKGTYNDIYSALAVFGIIVEEKEKENEL